MTQRTSMAKTGENSSQYLMENAYPAGAVDCVLTSNKTEKQYVLRMILDHSIFTEGFLVLSPKISIHVSYFAPNPDVQIS